MTRALSFHGIVLALCATFATATDWPEFLGPNRDNTSPETGLIDAIPEGGLKPIWARRVGSGYSAPSIRGEIMVYFHRVNDEETVEACHPVTGAKLWKHSYPSSYIDPFGYNNGPRCTPLLTEDRCFTFGAEGVLLCLDLKTGQQIWRRDILKEFEVPEAFFGVGSTPVLEDGRLFVMVGGQPNAGVVAFDAATGKTLWENVGERTWTGVPMTGVGWPPGRTVRWNRADPIFEKQASYCSPVLADIHGKRHLLCVMRQGLVSLVPATGEVNFSFWFRARQNESVNAMTPVVSGSEILLSSAYYRNGAVLLRVRPDGKGVEEVWRGRQLEMHWARPILHAGHLFAFSGRDEPDGIFRCVEWSTGNVKWERNEGWPNGGHRKLMEGEKRPDVFGRGSAILADGKLFVLGEAGLFGLFRPNAEKLDEIGRWQVPQLTYPCWTGPVLSNRKLYLQNEEWLLCFDVAKQGPARSRPSRSGEPQSDPGGSP